MDEFPEQIGRVRVSMTTGGGADTRVEPDEQADEVWGDGIGQLVHDVGIFTRRSVAGRPSVLWEGRQDRG